MQVNKKQLQRIPVEECGAHSGPPNNNKSITHCFARNETQLSDKKRNENIYYKKSRCCRGEELNETDDNGSVTTIYGGSG